MLAYIGACAGEGVVLADEFHGLVVAARCRKGDVAGDVHVRRAADLARHALARAAKAPAGGGVVFEVVAEGLHAHEHLLGGLVAYRAIGAHANLLGKVFKAFDRARIGGAADDLLEHVGHGAQAHAARRAFAAALRVRHAHERARHVDGAGAAGVRSQPSACVGAHFAQRAVGAVVLKQHMRIPSVMRCRRCILHLNTHITASCSVPQPLTGRTVKLFDKGLFLFAPRHVLGPDLDTAGKLKRGHPVSALHGAGAAGLLCE